MFYRLSIFSNRIAQTLAKILKFVIKKKGANKFAPFSQLNIIEKCFSI